jgi:hypothetical protein
MKVFPLILTFSLVCCSAWAQKKAIWTQSATTLEAYDYIECSIHLPKSGPGNPFIDYRLEGVFYREGFDSVKILGFCDDTSGKLFRIRYMPAVAGRYTGMLKLAGLKKTETNTVVFEVKSSSRPGLLRNDPDHPWHLIYENTKSHFFWNGTTTYWLAGWKSDEIISKSIDRLAALGVNRIRVAINGRAHGGDRWAEPTVVESSQFSFKLNPWLAKNPDDLDQPEFDTKRMNVDHWQKLDRILHRAREKNIIVSIIFYVDGLDHGCDPFKKANMGGPEEKMYYQYATARFAAYENLMWDIANEYHLFRTEAWADQMGTYLKMIDPYKHLISVHGHANFPFRKSPWVDVIMFQSWDECGGYSFITKARQDQEATGRILPIVNEEYGYEDHYPVWGCGATASKIPPDGRSAMNRARLAWEIYMAGGYQTTGESARYGTGAGEDWNMTPRNDLVSYGNYCLALPGKEYLLFTQASHCRLQLAPGEKYSVQKINPWTGESVMLPMADSNIDQNAWQYRQHLEGNWVFILKKWPN